MQNAECRRLMQNEECRMTDDSILNSEFLIFNSELNYRSGI